MAHTVVDDIHELQLLALTTGRCVILTDGHSLRFLSSLLGFEHRKRKFHTDLVVALPQFLELLLCDVELPACVEVDRVDKEVRVDVFPVCMSADQNFISLIVLGQLQCGRMSSDRIDRFVFWEALHHVVEQHAIRLVI